MIKHHVFRLTVIACFVSAPGIAHADSFQVGDLDASDAFEIKPFVEFETNDEETVLEGPALDLTMPLAPHLEVSTVFGSGSINEDGARARWGFIDTEFAMKWEILPVPEAGGLGITTEPAIIAPTGTRGLGDGEWRAELPVIVGWVSGPWVVRGQVGYERGLKSGDGEFFLGALVKYSLSDAVAVGAEIAGEQPNLGFGEYEPAVDVGITWEFAPGVEFQGRLGRQIHTRDSISSTNGLIAIEFAL